MTQGIEKIVLSQRWWIWLAGWLQSAKLDETRKILERTRERKLEEEVWYKFEQGYFKGSGVMLARTEQENELAQAC